MDDPLRDTPLGELQVRMCWTDQTGGWRTVTKEWKIANVTFNKLGPVWTEHSIFEVEVHSH